VTVVFGAAEDGIKDKVVPDAGSTTVKVALPLPHGLALVTACRPAVSFGTVNVSEIAPFSSASPVTSAVPSSHDRVTDWQ
jgi:hypothetical protein